MTEAFEKAFAYLLKDEGMVYTNDPKDSGGPTKYGITQTTFEQYFKRISSLHEIKDMSVETAKQIYFDLYWRPGGCDRISNLGLAACLFNSGVLYGTGTTSILAQNALNKCGAKLKSDGAFGDKSVAAINSVDVTKFLEAFHEQLLGRIETVIANNPKNERFRNGWTNRANRLLELGTDVAALNKIV